MSKPTFSESSEQAPVTFYRCESTLLAGLRQSWIDGNSADKDVSFALDAGVGSPYLIFKVTTPDGKETRDVVDVREMMAQRVNQVMGEFVHRQKIEAKAADILADGRLCVDDSEGVSGE